MKQGECVIRSIVAGRSRGEISISKEIEISIPASVRPCLVQVWSSLRLTLEVAVQFTGRAPRRGVGGWGRKNPSSRVAAGRWSGASWARSASGTLQCVHEVEAQGTSGVTWRDALWLYDKALLALDGEYSIPNTYSIVFMNFGGSNGIRWNTIEFLYST